MAERPPEPHGLVYQPDFITQAEEQQVLDVLGAMEFHSITMHGQTARRTVRHFGLNYGYESWKLVPTDPFADELGWLQERAAALAGLDPEEFATDGTSELVRAHHPGVQVAGLRATGVLPSARSGPAWSTAPLSPSATTTPGGRPAP